MSSTANLLEKADDCVNCVNCVNCVTWVENPLYLATPASKTCTINQSHNKPILPDIPQQVLIESEAQYPPVNRIEVPEFIYYEPYVLRFDRK